MKKSKIEITKQTQIGEILKLNPNVKIITSNLKEGTGLDEIIQVIKDKKESL